jgi:hypothetical protein
MGDKLTKEEWASLFGRAVKGKSWTSSGSFNCGSLLNYSLDKNGNIISVADYDDSDDDDDEWSGYGR